MSTLMTLAPKTQAAERPIVSLEVLQQTTSWPWSEKRALTYAANKAHDPAAGVIVELCRIHCADSRKRAGEEVGATKMPRLQDYAAPLLRRAAGWHGARDGAGGKRMEG